VKGAGEICYAIEAKSVELSLFELEMLVEKHLEVLDHQSKVHHLFMGTWIDITLFYHFDRDVSRKYVYLKPIILTLEQYWLRIRIVRDPDL